MSKQILSNRRVHIPTALLATIAVAVFSSSVATAASKDIVIGAREPGSSHYTFGAAIAGLLSKHTGKTGKVLAVAGAGVWLPMIKNKEADIGVISHFESWLASVGRKPFQSKHDVRLIAVGGGINVGVYVRKDSPIKSRADIKGKRIGCKYAASPAIHIYASAEIASAGYTWKDVKCIPRTSLYAGQRNDFKEKRLEVFYASVGSGLSRELDTTIGIRFLPIDSSPEAMARMRKIYPIVVTKVKAGPPGIRKDMMLTRLPVYIITHKNVSSDLIYQVAKTMWEHNAEFKKMNRRLRSWNTANFADPQAIIQYHEGAIRLYKEKGVWTKQMEEMKQKLAK